MFKPAVKAVRDETGRWEVFVETPVVETACPSCGVLIAEVLTAPSTASGTSRSMG